MISRRDVLVGVALFAAAGLAPAFAAQRVAFSPAAFEAAQKAGKPILVEIHADWCPVCRAQKETMAKFEGDPRFAGLAIFRVDFDAQKDAVRSFRAQQQSTMIVFKGGKETGRLVGQSDPLSLEDLLEKTL